MPFWCKKEGIKIDDERKNKTLFTGVFFLTCVDRAKKN